MSADEAREALEPVIQQMVQALLEHEDDDDIVQNREMSVLTGWVLVTSSLWPGDDGGTVTTVRVTPREGQADHVTCGLLRYADKLLWEC